MNLLVSIHRPLLFNLLLLLVPVLCLLLRRLDFDLELSIKAIVLIFSGLVVLSLAVGQLVTALEELAPKL